MPRAEARRRSDESSAEASGRGGESAGASAFSVEAQAAEGRDDNAAGIGVRGMIDLDFVRGLIAAVDESGIDSIEISRAGTRIRVSKSPPPVAAASSSALPGAVMQAAPGALPAPQAGGASGPAAPSGEAPASDAAGDLAATDASLVEVRSPMVGTFYRAPAPEAPPYVEAGSRVGVGQTLCILEAMKLMNELESEVEGTIREILVGNAEPVEYGQILFKIEPTGS